MKKPLFFNVFLQNHEGFVLYPCRYFFLILPIERQRPQPGPDLPDEKKRTKRREAQKSRRPTFRESEEQNKENRHDERIQ